MSNDKIEYFEWIKTIETNKLISEWEKKKNISPEKINSYKFKDKVEIKDEIDILQDELKSGSKRAGFSIYSTSANLINERILLEFLIQLLDIKSFDNKKCEKVRKHKIVYFLYGFHIYMRSKYEILTKEDIFVFEKKINMKFVAFERGPVLKNVYNWGLVEDKIFYLSGNLSELDKEVLELGYFLLNLYTTNVLVEKSHETDPWKNNWKENSYYKEIKDFEITNWFSINAPFFYKE
ncbi:MAG: hypothetical protein GQ557_00810 [Mycoplasmataceae bacterium]|nr:hypothetical protein [Mycoplasmataceae bacterium]